MLDDDKRFIEELNGHTPAVLVAYGLAMCVPDIRRMLGTFARRYQPGTYEPQQHALAVATGWKTALLNPMEASAGGSQQHKMYGVSARPDLIYLVGVALTVLMVRAHAQQPGAVITRRQMQALENSLELALGAYGVPSELCDNVAWPTHEQRFDAAVGTLNPHEDTVNEFWVDVVKRLGLDTETARAVQTAFDTLTPGKIAVAFGQGFDRHFPDADDGEPQP